MGEKENEILDEQEHEEENEDDGEIRRKVVKKTTYKIDEVRPTPSVRRHTNVKLSLY